MMIPESAKTNPYDNNFFEHALSAWDRMTDIYTGETTYISDDFAILINTLERFYKGFLQYQMDINPDFKLPNGYLSNDHDILKLTKKIEQFTPLFACKDNAERADKNLFFKKIRKDYTQARYTVMVPKEDFCNLYEFVDKQRQLLCAYLDKERKAEEKESEYALDY